MTALAIAWWPHLPAWFTWGLILVALFPFVGGVLSILAELLLGQHRRFARRKRNLVLLGGFLGIFGALCGAVEQARDTYQLESLSTGGDGYIYLEIGDIAGPLGADSGILKKGMMVANTSYKFVGIYPLHNVYLSEFGPLGWGSQIDYGTVFPNEIGRPRPLPYIYFYPNRPNQIFHFSISASNGSYHQVVLVKQFGDKWLWAARFLKYGQKQPIRTWAAPGFPEADLNADWDKLE